MKLKLMVLVVFISLGTFIFSQEVDGSASVGSIESIELAATAAEAKLNEAEGNLKIKQSEQATIVEEIAHIEKQMEELAAKKEMASDKLKAAKEAVSVAEANFDTARESNKIAQKALKEAKKSD